MSSKRLYADYLHDIVDYAEKAMRFVHGVSFDDFCDNEEKILAVVRALEVIGEAARNVPKSARDKYSRVPWKKVTGMRDKVTHKYFGVDLDVVLRIWRSETSRKTNSTTVRHKHKEGPMFCKSIYAMTMLSLILSSIAPTTTSATTFQPSNYLTAELSHYLEPPD